MITMAMDTLKVSTELQHHGISTEHANAITKAIAESHTIDVNILATKDDIKSTKNDIEQLRIATKDDIKATKDDIKEVKTEMRWMFGILFAFNLAAIAKQFF